MLKRYAVEVYATLSIISVLAVVLTVDKGNLWLSAGLMAGVLLSSAALGQAYKVRYPG